MPPVLFNGVTEGLPITETPYNDNWTDVETTFGHLGPYVISGLTLSAGSGLAANIAAGTAIIGGPVVVAATIAASGLTPSTTNHIYLQQDGSATSNTTGVQPANTVKLGTATTDASTVTSSSVNWASGRQTHVKLQSAIHGSGVGHPRAVDLASWHATNNEGNEVKGTLPTGAVPTAGNTLTGTEAAKPAASQAGRLYLPNDGFYLWRDSGSAWAPWGPLFPMTPPVNGDFAWVNQGSATVTTTNGGIHLSSPTTGSANMRIRKKAAPATPWTLTAAFITFAS